VTQGSLLGPLFFILHENDLPRASHFSTTLFADDTYLTMSDKNFRQLENKGNYQLQLINQRLKKNKLTLNYSKNTYLLFNKQPHVPVSSKFNLYLNQIKIKRSGSVKYCI